jgi:hypothetical protein
MNANQQPSQLQFFGLRQTRNQCSQHRLRRNGVLCSLGTAGLVSFAFLLALNMRAAGQDAQRASSTSGVFANTTSLNGPGNVFLTANLYGSGGNGTVFVAVGDFNGDGKVDLVIADWGPPGVSILLSNGDGTFQPARSFAAGTNPSSVAVGDFNGDGKLDLAVANWTSNDVSVLLGNGDGTFQPAVSFAAGNTPRSVAVADFNHDGKLDLVVANWGCNQSCAPGNVSVLLGNGDGTFRPAQNFSVGVAPVSVAVGDFNGDGIPDLAVANAGDPIGGGQLGSVSVLLGVGDGTFRPAADLSAGSSPSSVALGDFNGDGKLDLAVTDSVTGSVLVLLGNRDGSFQTARGFPSDSGAHSLPDGIAVGDFNGDGKPDLLVANNAFDTFSVLLGVGDGSFGPPISFAAGGAPEAVAVGDFNGDGLLDMAGVNSVSGTVSVLLGSGDGRFLAARSYPTNGASFFTAAADFNNDGKLDVVTPGSLLLGNGDGTFQPPQDLASGSEPFSVAIGDFNGDGNLDLAITNNDGSSNVSILLGNGDGTFRPAMIFDVGAPARSVAVGDFNGDGRLDLAVTNVGCLQCPPSTVAVLLGNGDGTFQAAKTFSVGSDPESLATADLNGDGKLDLVIADGANGASVLLGNGDGTFQPVQFFPAGSFPASVTVRDFNGDGKPDLVVVNSASGGPQGAVFLLLGNGDGTFQTAKNLATLGDLWSVVIGDFNGDGKPDVAVTSGDSAYVLLGDGEGNFQAPQTFAASGDGLSVAAGDFHGDGKLDLVVSNFSSTLSLLRNDSTLPSYVLTVNKGGNGIGTVTSSPAGISCGLTCAASYASGTVTTLTAQASKGSRFSRWRGCDSAVGFVCTVKMSAARRVTVIFNLHSSTLRVNKDGFGRGTVASTSVPTNATQINCGFVCSASYPSDAIVTLTAAPGSGTVFLGWNGCDTASGFTCTILMSAARSVGATFVPSGGPGRGPILPRRGVL